MNKFPNTRPLRIAFLTINDPKDKQSWSGTIYYIGKALEKYVGEVDFLGPVKISSFTHLRLRFIAKITRLFFKKEFAAKYSLVVSKAAAKHFTTKLKAKEYDYIVAPAAAVELACLDVNAPVVYLSDTTFSLIVDYYHQDFGQISNQSRKQGNQLEQLALDKSDFIMYPSVWAADSAINTYKAPPQNVHVFQFGANIDVPPSSTIIYEKLKNEDLTLLFLAVDWERKGGEIVFDTLKKLLAAGTNARLIVCGCIPPQQFQHERMEVIPFINKNDKAQYAKFIELLTTSHFLILPTRADCSSMVGAEASAYGMPAIASRTGGVPDVIVDGVNGYCLPIQADGSKYASLIAEIYNDKTRYKELISSSRKRFETDLNWEKWAEKFKKILLENNAKGLN